MSDRRDDRIMRMSEFLRRARLERARRENRDVGKDDQAQYLSDNSLGIIVPPTTYGPWERGHRLPESKYWPALSERLGPEFDRILGLGARVPKNALAEWIVSRLPAMSDDAQRDILEFARRRLEDQEEGDSEESRLRVADT